MKEIDFIEVDNVLINTEITETEFTCDLGKCKGACCTIESKYGAPITKDEISIINKYLSVIKEYLSTEKIKEIERKGFWIKEYDEFMTRSINERDCVFVYYEGDIAKCGIEKAFYDGRIDFRKPISCHLFPIRISNFGGPVLRFEKYSVCKPALINGNKTKITAFDFCREALERMFGTKWYIKTKKVIGN